jgi:hypothetical protein
VWPSLPRPFAQQHGNDDCSCHGADTSGCEVKEIAVAIWERALKQLDQGRTRQRQDDGPQQRSTPVAPSETPEEEKGQAAEQGGVNDLVQNINDPVEIGKDLDDFLGAGQRRERDAEQYENVGAEDEAPVSCDPVQLMFFCD